MSVSDTNKNRGAHGDSSSTLGRLRPSSENPSGFSRGECQYGVELDRNGYAPSVIQSDMSCCFRCRRTNDKLDRHELYGNAYREKSKRLGAWVLLCHSTCHEGRNGVHQNANEGRYLKQLGQKAMIAHYHWTTQEFINQFGKNYLEG